MAIHIKSANSLQKTTEGIILIAQTIEYFPSHLISNASHQSIKMLVEEPKADEPTSGVRFLRATHC